MRFISAAKAATKAAVKITVKVAQMVNAAIAAPPFGIFISDEAADNDSISISAIVAECNMELSNKLDDIENAAAADRSEIIGEQANLDLISKDKLQNRSRVRKLHLMRSLQVKV